MGMLQVSQVDVLLVSARMEGEPYLGIALLRQLRVERPSLKAVVLLDSNHEREVVEAFHAGACGVFCRSAEINMLPKCIAAVDRGQIWANSEELGFVLAALAEVQPFHCDSKRLPALSTREKEVVRCLVEGLTNREIARTLAISQHTVKNYVYNIFDKLGVSNRVEVVFRVLTAPATLDFKPPRENPKAARPEITTRQPKYVFEPQLPTLAESTPGLLASEIRPDSSSHSVKSGRLKLAERVNVG